MSAGSAGAFVPVRRRWHRLWRELSLAEVSGAFGDVGTFLPLLVRLPALPGPDKPEQAGEALRRSAPAQPGRRTTAGHSGTPGTIFVPALWPSLPGLRRQLLDACGGRLVCAADAAAGCPASPYRHLLAAPAPGSPGVAACGVESCGAGRSGLPASRGGRGARARDGAQVGLVQCAGLDLGTTLVATGAYNIALGAAFGIPLPVQPMKAIAAVALSREGLGMAEVTAAGLFVSGVVFLLGATRLINVFNRRAAERGDAACSPLQLPLRERPRRC